MKCEICGKEYIIDAGWLKIYDCGIMKVRWIR